MSYVKHSILAELVVFALGADNEDCGQSTDSDVAMLI